MFSYYDRSGRKAAQIDQAGYQTKWTLDAEGNVLTETRYATAVTGYSTIYRPEPTPSADDRTTTFTYDRAGHRTSETRERVVAYTVNGSGGLDLDARTDSTITYRYNGLGEVRERIEANGDTTTYAYDKAGRLETEVRASYLSDANATVSPRLTYRYDALGNLVRTEQGAVEEVAGDPVRVTRSIYGAGGRLASTVNAADEATDYGYDAAGNVVTQTYKRRAADGTSTDEGLLITRDQLGRVASQTLGTYASGTWAKGDVQQFEYNLHGEVARRGVNGGWQEEFAYDAGGRLWRSNAGDGVWRYFVSDANGNRTATIESEGNAIAGLTIDQAMWMAGNGSFAVGRDYIDGLNVTVSVHDGRGQQTDVLQRHRETSVGALWTLWTSRAYTAFGEVASDTAALRRTDAERKTTTYKYNTMGRLIETTRPVVDVMGENGVMTPDVAPVERTYYDLSGRAIGADDALRTAFPYSSARHTTVRLLLAGTGHGGSAGNSEALVAREWHADGGVVVNGYDRFGDLTGATDEVLGKSVMTYDKMGRLTSVTRPSGQWEQYAYDQLGQRIAHWSSGLAATEDAARALAETTSYDRQGRVTATRGFGGAGVGEVTKTEYSWQASLSNAGLGTSGGWKQLTTAANDRVSSEISDAFGHVTYAGDLGGHVTTFTYDLAGRLAKSETVGGETVATRWLNTGLAGVVTSDLGTVAAPERGRAVYGYDAAGRKVSESYVLDGVQRQNATARYDALGRMVEWKELGNAVVPASYLLTDYDKVGNVVHTKASHVGLDAQGNWTAAREDEVWTRHDVMNRVTTAGGSLVNNAIVRGATGQDLTYNAAGERATATRTVSRTKVVPNPYYNPGDGNSEVYINDRLVDNNPTTTVRYDTEQREDFAYDGDGRLVDVRVAEGAATYRPSDTEFEEGTVTVAPPPAQGTRRASYTYTTMGRLEYQADYGSNGTSVVYDRRLDYDVRGRVGTETSNVARGAETVRTEITTGYGTGTGSALGAPVTVSTKTFVNDGYRSTATTTHDYAWYTGAVQAKTTHRPDTARPELFTTDYGYDTAGRLTGVHIADGRPRDVAFVNDLAGQALARDEADNLATGDPHQRWYRFDGREMGSISNDGTDETSYAVSIDRRLAAAAPDATGPFRDGGAASVANADYDGQVRSITSFSSAGAAGGIHTVREGDTLAGLAASLWGDASLWYKLASANGLSAASALVPGQTLTIPAGVTRSGRTAATFKPFDAGEVQGDLSPTTPKPQAAAARHNKCGAFGAILLTVVAVAVTAIVVGPASAGFASLFQGGALAGSAAAASAATAGAIVGGAVAGAAGSIISQGVGLATGLQDKFSWKGVALAGIGGAVGGGLRGFDAFSKLGGATSFVNDVARGALGSAISQGVGVATGLQSKFDFVGVAAAGIGAGIGGAVGRGIGFDPNLQGFHPGNIALGAVANTASAIANAATRSALSGTNFGDNVIRALPDAIGNAIGQLAAAGASTAFDGINSRALAKAKASPVEQPKLTSEQRAVLAAGGLTFDEQGMAKASSFNAAAIEKAAAERGFHFQHDGTVRAGSNGYGWLPTEVADWMAPNAQSLGGVNFYFGAGSPASLDSYSLGYDGGQGAVRFLVSGAGVAVYNGGDVTYAGLNLRVNYGTQAPPTTTAAVSPAARRAAAESGGFLNAAGDFLSGAVLGGFSDRTSGAAIAGQVIGGFLPVADARDIAAGLYHVARGRSGALTEVGLAMVGAVPLIGDAGKVLLKHGDEALDTASALYRVGPYNEIKGIAPGLDAHHVGQKALMAKMIPDYDPLTAPAILVPKAGHSIRDLERGIVSRSTAGLETPRAVVARDIMELRRVYPDIPNAQLQQLIRSNKTAYPQFFIKGN